MDRIVVLQNEKGKEISKSMRKGNNDFQPVKIIPRRDKSGEVILIEVKPQKMK
jgi:tRNA1(Val) A37 N6-methylase TrmN6